MTPWRFVTTFGAVSLLCDVVYEGARSVTGPYLATLGATATAVGLITGVGETLALAGRLGTGPLADRTRAYWPLTVLGYSVTVLAVPALGLTTVLWVAALLIVSERAGKAIRSPAKDVMLSHATATIGRGRGFALHEALDQIGAVIGPLIVAGVLAFTAGHYAPAFVSLAVPGVAAMLVLLWLRSRVPDPAGRYEPAAPHMNGPLPRAFHRYLAFTILSTAGFATFGVIGFHLAQRAVLPVAAIPVLYDRIGVKVLAAVPVLTALTPVLAFSTNLSVAVAGALAWAAALGMQESTMRAAVADLVPARRRGTAYGIFAAGAGAATFVGGVLTGALYDRSLPALITTVAVLQAAALALLLSTTRPQMDRTSSGSRPGR
jgi:MFS family permease